MGCGVGAKIGYNDAGSKPRRLDSRCRFYDNGTFKFSIVLNLFVFLTLPKILSLGKMQASLLLPSLIRIFDSVLDTFASAMLK